MRNSWKSWLRRWWQLYVKTWTYYSEHWWVPWSSWMSTPGMWWVNSPTKRSTTWTILNSQNSWGITGMLKSTIVSLNKPTPPSGMATSIWEMDPDLSLPLWLINATLHWPVPNTCILVVPQLALQVQAKPKLPRILQRHLQFNVSSSIVQTVSISKPWEGSSVDWPKEEPGHASMSSTVSILKCCRLSLSKF